MGAGIGGKCTFSDETLTHICIHFIFIANKSSGLHFPSNDIGLTSFKFFRWAVGAGIFARGRFCRSRASKVTDIGANRKRGVDFLVVRNSNFGPVLHRFGNLTGFMCYLPHPIFNHNFGGVAVAPDRPCWASTGTWTLSYSAVKLFSKNSNLFEHGT